ncbi:MAG TPA: TolC family protein [Bacteroidales bacterium]|jgi:outer membrane protein|nr:TolC family protein [Bacteroidales bacterium]HPB88747.1 TolC family protein [Bacteroidales bacterium]HPH52678.1 TolC family protein [Bacteroidales bacterium]HPY22412.1 TolC family protein [Bacteroidales bacterium]HQN24389.1 TolC family protein [Bacteroidales bacterium]
MKKKLIITVAALFCSGFLFAQEVMTLKECMHYAVENSSRVKIQQMEVDDARVARRDAILNMFTPQVSAGTYAYSNFGRSVDPETNTYVSTASFNNVYTVGGGITLFNGFASVNNAKISKTALKMGIDRETLIKDEVCLATMEAYYNVVYFGQLAELLENQVATAQGSLKLAKKQEELGQKSYSDVIEMEAELYDREYRLVMAKNQYEDALLKLKDMMFWPLDEELVIDASMVIPENVRTLIVEEETEELVDYAIHSLPSIAIARGAMENAKRDYSTAKWAFSPKLSLQGGWATSYYTYPRQKDYIPLPFETQFRNNANQYIQLSLTFPIFDRLSTFSNIRKKKNAYSKATVQYEQKLRDVETEVIRAVKDRDGTYAAYEQADCMARLQEEAYRLNVRKFEQGLISTIDFQKASDNWLNAKTGRLDALLKFYIKKSVVDYYGGIGYLEQ